MGKAHGPRSLFEGLSFGLFEGDQVGLVGPNGAGKSTLLRILAGIESPDRGQRSLRSGVRVGYVPQDPVFPPEGTVEDVLTAVLSSLDEYERAGRIAQALGRAGFDDGRAEVAALSGGWRKRLAIARELAGEPDVLLMDEPTNHLDVEGILWLEGLLTERGQRACLVVSHDRYFLEHVATRMLEVNRVYPSGLFETEGRYSEFLTRRDEFLRGPGRLRGVPRQYRAPRDRVAAARRQGPLHQGEGPHQGSGSADRGARRRARAGGHPHRRHRLHRLRPPLAPAARRPGAGQIARRPALVRDLDLVITPGTRIGLMGPNGSGKTTLLNVLAGALAPDAGTIERAEDLRVVRFEQQRPGLDPTLSLRRALAPEGDTVTFQGRTLHVAAWAKRFLFPPDQLEVSVGRLSGGEQARIHIARLMREPADLLILDEPTNDLDIPTLDVLEESLTTFEGGLVLVTHDRFMLDRVATAIVALDGRGGAEKFADYAQWEVARRRLRGRAEVPSPCPLPRGERERGGRRGGSSGIWSSGSSIRWRRRSWPRRPRWRPAAGPRRTRGSPPIRRRCRRATRRSRPPARRWTGSTPAGRSSRRKETRDE